MPLPTQDTAWPPKPYDKAVARMVEHDAWYKGDQKSLSDVYSKATDPAPRIRASQLSGGLVGAVARMFWGRPVPTNHANTRLHVPVPADIATASADLLFSEPPRLILPKRVSSTPGVASSNPAQERLEAIFNNPLTQAELLEAAELSAALSGTFLRVVWDTTVSDQVMVDAVAADQGVPEWRYGRLAAVTFWRVVHRDGNIVWRHLERHEPGAIYHGLYVGTTTHLGTARPLQDHPDTAWAAPLVNADGAILTDVEWITAAYIPNMRPQKAWRDIPALAPLGRSDYDGVEGIFDAIDEVYSSWMRDIRLAKARLIVPEAYLSSLGPGKGASFDIEQELFVGLNMLGKGVDDTALTPQQFEIRNAEHEATIANLTRTALRAAGYSSSTFGDESIQVTRTATEVKSDERLSERTRDKKVRYWKAALGPFARTVLAIDSRVFNRGGTVSGEIPDVRFPEKAQQDMFELAQTAQALRGAEAASTDVLVRMVHPDWDTELVDAEVTKILNERKMGLPADPFEPIPGTEAE